MRIEIKTSFVKDLRTAPKDAKRDGVCNPVTHVLYADVFKRFRRGCKPRPAWTYQNFYRIQVGAYRLGFVLEENTIVLVRFLHRKEIYRFFP